MLKNRLNYETDMLTVDAQSSAAIVIYHNIIVGKKYAKLLLNHGYTVAEYVFSANYGIVKVLINSKLQYKFSYADLELIEDIEQYMQKSQVAVIEANVGDRGETQPNWQVLNLVTRMPDKSRLGIFSGTSDCIKHVIAKHKEVSKLNNVELLAYLFYPMQDQEPNPITAEMFIGSHIVPILVQHFYSKFLSSELMLPDWDTPSVNQSFNSCTGVDMPETRPSYDSSGARISYDCNINARAILSCSGSPNNSPVDSLSSNSLLQPAIDPAGHDNSWAKISAFFSKIINKLFAKIANNSSLNVVSVNVASRQSDVHGLIGTTNQRSDDWVLTSPSDTIADELVVKYQPSIENSPQQPLLLSSQSQQQPKLAWSSEEAHSCAGSSSSQQPQFACEVRQHEVRVIPRCRHSR